jgi:carbonic anhydrase
MRSSQEELARKYARPEEVSRIKFYAFTNLDENAKEQVRKIKEHPLIPKSIRVSGFIYEVETGKLRRVVYEPQTGEPATVAAQT